MTVGEQCLQPRDCDELALGQLDDIVAAVEVHELIRRRFCHDIASFVVTVLVED
ncbi:hypothetical protein D3C81_2303370 [compost metagenome]